MKEGTGIDQKKIAIVRTCLEIAGFLDIGTKEYQQIFVFNDGKNRYELEFERAHIDDITEAKLMDDMESRIIPAIKNNPGNRIHASKDGLKVLNINSN